MPQRGAPGRPIDRWTVEAASERSCAGFWTGERGFSGTSAGRFDRSGLALDVDGCAAGTADLGDSFGVEASSISRARCANAVISSSRIGFSTGADDDCFVAFGASTCAGLCSSTGVRRDGIAS